MGFLIKFDSDLFDLNAIASEIGPTLPKYIVIIIIILPNKFKELVKFLERPTVAVALTVSYNISVIDASIVNDSNNVDKNIIENDIHVTATAFLVISLESVLLNKTTPFLFLIQAIAIATNDTIVTVLIPPAVPTGEPPININIKQINTVEFVSDS